MISATARSLPFKFFEEAFPITCQDIVLTEVRISVFTLELILLFVVGEKARELQHIPCLLSIVATSRVLALETYLDKLAAWLAAAVAAAAEPPERTQQEMGRVQLAAQIQHGSEAY